MISLRLKWFIYGKIGHLLGKTNSQYCLPSKWPSNGLLRSKPFFVLIELILPSAPIIWFNILYICFGMSQLYNLINIFDIISSHSFTNVLCGVGNELAGCCIKLL